MPSAIKLGGHRQLLSTPQDQGTRIAFKDIFLDDVYGLTRLKGTVKTVLDVGAHVGLFSLYSRILFPEAIIHAYEPNPTLWKHLTQQSSIGRFEMFSQAVGLSEGRVSLLTESDSVLTRTVINPTGPVSMVSIQQALQQLGGTVDILKLDCEGAEWEILKNKAAMSAVRFLTLEYHLIENRSLDEMVRLLNENGLRIVFCHQDSPGNGRIWAVADYDTTQ
jgi:FkbM family methyltransferase